MDAVVKKWGNSLGIRIPAAIAKEVPLQEGTTVEIQGEEGRIVIRPKKKFELGPMLDEVTSENLHAETEVDGPRGREAW